MAGDHDFTEAEYRDLLRLAKRSYRFIRFPKHATARSGAALWRHDVDFSVHRALALARIEAEEGVHATYFVNLHSRFYNALEEEVATRIDEIASLGHDLGLHFDPTFYAARGPGLDEALRLERNLLEELFATPIDAFSLHNPQIAGWSSDRDEIEGMVNAYGAGLKARFAYCSDSHGEWRHRPLREVLESGEDERLQVLTHPEWWVPEPMPPANRVERAISGRAASVRARYSETVERILAR